MARCFLSALLLMYFVAATALAQTEVIYSGNDVSGDSPLCKQILAQFDVKQCVKGEKQYTELKLSGKEWVRVVSPRNIKKQLFEKLSQSFQFDAEVIQHVGQVELWQLPEIKKSLTQARQSCGAAAGDDSLAQAFDKLIVETKADNPVRQQIASLSDNEKENITSRYLLAREELLRINRSINSKFVHGADLERLKAKRQQLQLRYPLAQQITPWAVEDLLKQQEKMVLASPVIISRDEEELVDITLGLKTGDVAPLYEKTKALSKLHLSTQVAHKILRKEPFSNEVKKEIMRDWQTTYSEKITSLGRLCQASTCQAYEVSLQSTAELVTSTPDKERVNLLGDICQCNLSSSTKWVPTEVRYAMLAAAGSGLVACLATNVACPALATIGLVGTTVSAVDAVANWKDMARGQDALEMARQLDGLDPDGSERKRLEHFSGNASLKALGSAAMASAGGFNNFKAALSPIDATKTIMRANAVKGKANQWLKELMNKNPEYSRLPTSELRRISNEVVEKGEGFVAEILKGKDFSLRSYLNRDGELILKYSEPAKYGSQAGTMIERVLAVDAKTGAIDANFKGADRMVKALTENSENGVVVIFTDLNYLGQTNYFHHGQAAGDLYLQAFGTGVRANLRPGDIMLKTGGDELVSILPINDPNLAQPGVVKGIMQRMVDNVSKNPEAQLVFKRQFESLVQEYVQIGRATGLKDIPADIVSKLSQVQLRQAANNFEEFQRQFLDAQSLLLQQHARLRPSISIGGAIIPKGGSYAEGKMLAEQQATAVKVGYKGRMGFSRDELEKYRLQMKETDDEIFRRSGETRPQALEPLILRPNSGD